MAYYNMTAFFFVNLFGLVYLALPWPFLLIQCILKTFPVDFHSTVATATVIKIEKENGLCLSSYATFGYNIYFDSLI